MHQDLVDPLTKYLAHLKECEALFVTETGKQWCRKDVHGSTINFCKQFSKHEINPRKLRSTLAHELAATGVPQNVISLVLRHKDPATAARYYTSVQDIGLARNAINSFNPFR
ncbi:MAG: tyrosine-type recombinase/integrase [Chloroflexota bacterium]